MVIFDDGEHGEPVLGFRDADGAFVHRPMPAEYSHEAVGDAEEPCPLCGAIEYEVYFPTEDWRGGSGRKGTESFAPNPLIVCRVCGVQHEGGGLMRFAPTDSEDEDEAAREARLARVRAERAVQRWYQNKMTLMNVPFPVYAAEGWPARINGSGSSNGNLTRLVIAHAETLPDSIFIPRPRIAVTTSIEQYQPGELAIARAAFAPELARDAVEEPTEGLSDAALTLWFRAAARRSAARSHEAPVSETEIMIDGAPAPFVTVGTPNAEWVAVRRHHDVTITVAGLEIDPASLNIEPIPDLEGRLLGPKHDEP